jgi:hypothetical protein
LVLRQIKVLSFLNFVATASIRSAEYYFIVHPSIVDASECQKEVLSFAISAATFDQWTEEQTKDVAFLPVEL